MDQNHSGDREGEMRSVDPGDPNNDQMLAQTRDDLREILDVTVHPIIDQAEAQDAGLPSMMAVLALYLIDHDDQIPRERLASVLALSLFMIAKNERVVTSDGRSIRP